MHPSPIMNKFSPIDHRSSIHYRSFLMVPDSAFKHVGTNGLSGQPSNTTDSHRIHGAPCSKMHMKGSCQMYNSMCCFTGYRGMSVAPSKVWCGHQDDIFSPSEQHGIELTLSPMEMVSLCPRRYVRVCLQEGRKLIVRKFARHACKETAAKRCWSMDMAWVGRGSQAFYPSRNTAMDDSIGGS